MYCVVNSYRATGRVGTVLSRWCVSAERMAERCVPAAPTPAPGSRPGVFYQQFACGV